MAAIERLAIFNLSGSGSTGSWSSDSTYLCSVIATNKSDTANATISAWVAPLGDNSAEYRGYIAYKLPLSVSNTYETIRFPVISTDVIYVEVNGNVSFSIAGIDQLNV